MEQINLTNTLAGLAAIQRCMAGEDILFTKLEIGDGVLTTPDISGMTGLINKTKEYPLGAVQAEESEVIRVRSNISNKDVAEDLIIREYGIYAKFGEEQEFLFAYLNVGESTTPLPSQRIGRYELNRDFVLYIGNSLHVDFTSNGHLVYVAVNEYKDDMNRKANVVGTIEDLKNSKKYKVGDVVEVLGYYSAGDGGGHPRQKAPEGYNGKDAIIGHDGSIWKILYNEKINLSWFGTRGDGITDETEIIEKGLKFCYGLDIKQIIINPYKYKVNGIKLFMKPGTKTRVVDFRGAEFVGNGMNAGETLFTSYVLDGTTEINSFDLVDNEKYVIVGTSIQNFKITNFTYGLKLKNYNMGCYVENITGYNTKQIIHTRRCFYLNYKNLTPRIYEQTLEQYLETPLYYIEGNENNAMLFENINLCPNTKLGMLITGKTRVLEFINSTFEGASIGIRVLGDIQNIKFSNCYFESLKSYAVTNMNEDGSYYGTTESLDFSNCLFEGIPKMFDLQFIKKLRFRNNNKVISAGWFTDRSQKNTGLIDLATRMDFCNETFNPVWKIKDGSVIDSYKAVLKSKTCTFDEKIGVAEITGTDFQAGKYNGKMSSGYNGSLPLCIYSKDLINSKLIITTSILNSMTQLLYLNLKIVDFKKSFYIKGLIIGNRILNLETLNYYSDLVVINVTADGFLELIIDVEDDSSLSGAFRGDGGQINILG